LAVCPSSFAQTDKVMLPRICYRGWLFPAVEDDSLDRNQLWFKDARMEAVFCRANAGKIKDLVLHCAVILFMAASLQLSQLAYLHKAECRLVSVGIAPCAEISCAIVLVGVSCILRDGSRWLRFRRAVIGVLEPVVTAMSIMCMLCTPLMHPSYSSHLFGCEGSHLDPDSADAMLHVSLIFFLVIPHFILPVRWCALWPVYACCILVYSVCFLVIGGKEQRTLFSMSGMFFFLCMLYLSMLGKRRAEVSDRLLCTLQSYPASRAIRASETKKQGQELSNLRNSDTSPSLSSEKEPARNAPWEEFRNRLQELTPSQNSMPVSQVPLPSPFNKMNEDPSAKLMKNPDYDQPNSAPAVLMPSFMKQLAVCEAGSGDCLPPDAVVWVENKPMPTPLAEVQPGERVMCYDRLSICMKYATVTRKKVQDGEVEWVTVVLADGSSMLMTSDHPVHRDTGKHAIKAAKLKPGKDSIMLLKMVPVFVERVIPMAPKESFTPHTRVTLSVHHEERHSIFVGAPGQNPSIAVGSAGVDAWSYRSSELDNDSTKVTVKNTFIHASQQRSEDVPTLRRSNSAPCLQRDDGEHNRAEDTAGWQASGDQGSSDFSNDITISTSEMSKDSVEIMIPDLHGNPCRLSQLFHVQKEGLSSFGGAMHKQGECRACVFYSKTPKGIPGNCAMGSLCAFCHEEHAYKKKRGRGGARNSQ